MISQRIAIAPPLIAWLLVNTLFVTVKLLDFDKMAPPSLRVFDPHWLNVELLIDWIIELVICTAELQLVTCKPVIS